MQMTAPAVDGERHVMNASIFNPIKWWASMDTFTTGKREMLFPLKMKWITIDYKWMG